MSEVVGKTIEEKVHEFLGHYKVEDVKYVHDYYTSFVYEGCLYEVFTDGELFIRDSTTVDTEDLQMLFEITVFMKNLKGM